MSPGISTGSAGMGLVRHRHETPHAGKDRSLTGQVSVGRGLCGLCLHARMGNMSADGREAENREALDARFRRWRATHRTPSTVLDAHREVILERVSQSMTFEGEPVTVSRLKTLLEQSGPWPKNPDT
jgi:hypothetical protein